MAQDYPARPVRLLVGFPPGGAMDSAARVISPKLAEALGQAFVVENRTGAGGAIAADALVKAAADGYTLLLAESGTLIIPSMNSKVTYDPLRQFAPVPGVGSPPPPFLGAPGGGRRNAAGRVAGPKAKAWNQSRAPPRAGNGRALPFVPASGPAGV